MSLKIHGSGFIVAFSLPLHYIIDKENNFPFFHCEIVDLSTHLLFAMPRKLRQARLADNHLSDMPPRSDPAGRRRGCLARQYPPHGLPRVPPIRRRFLVRAESSQLRYPAESGASGMRPMRPKRLCRLKSALRTLPDGNFFFFLFISFILD